MVPLSSNSDVQKALNHALRVTATEVNEEPEERRETIESTTTVVLICEVMFHCRSPIGHDLSKAGRSRTKLFDWVD